MPKKLKHLSFYDIDELPQGSEQWMLFRRNKVTASNAYTLLTKGKHAAILANRGNVHDNTYTDRGHSLEAEVKEVLNGQLADKGFKLVDFGSITNDNYPDCGYSPDAVMLPTGMGKIGWDEWHQLPLVEVKCYNDHTKNEYTGKENHPYKHTKCVDDFSNVPLSAVVQMNFGMMIAERDICYLVLYNPDCEDQSKRIKIWPVERDDRLIARLEEKLNA